MKLPSNLSIDTVIEAAQRSFTSLDSPGFCLTCGQEVEGVEPDARNYTCEFCGEQSVYGAEEILISHIP